MAPLSCVRCKLQLCNVYSGVTDRGYMIYNLNLCVSWPSLARDQTANHVDMIYVCGLCSKAYQSVEEVERHAKLHWPL